MGGPQNKPPLRWKPAWEMGQYISPLCRLYFADSTKNEPNRIDFPSLTRVSPFFPFFVTFDHMCNGVMDLVWRKVPTAKAHMLTAFIMNCLLWGFETMYWCVFEGVTWIEKWPRPCLCMIQFLFDQLSWGCLISNSVLKGGSLSPLLCSLSDWCTRPCLTSWLKNESGF